MGLKIRISVADLGETNELTNVNSIRGGLQLSDISENPNNDRIGGDPPTHPPNPNKCLMLDVFVVLHIPGIHRLLPTTSTVHGENGSFIPTENGAKRLDCAFAVVTITGLNLSLPWLDAGPATRLLGAGRIPVNPCPFGLSKFQEVRPASSSFQLPKSISHCVIRTVAGSDVLKKDSSDKLSQTKWLAYPNQHDRFRFYTHEMRLESWEEKY